MRSNTSSSPRRTALADRRPAVGDQPLQLARHDLPEQRLTRAEPAVDRRPAHPQALGQLGADRAADRPGTAPSRHAARHPAMPSPDGPSGCELPRSCRSSPIRRTSSVPRRERTGYSPARVQVRVAAAHDQPRDDRLRPRAGRGCAARAGRDAAAARARPPVRGRAHLFRRCGPIWLTFAAAHAVAAARDRPEDWWALAWLRGTEIATDVVWSRSAGRVSARGEARVCGWRARSTWPWRSGLRRLARAPRASGAVGRSRASARRSVRWPASGALGRRRSARRHGAAPSATAAGSARCGGRAIIPERRIEEATIGRGAGSSPVSPAATAILARKPRLAGRNASPRVHQTATISAGDSDAYLDSYGGFPAPKTAMISSPRVARRLG